MNDSSEHDANTAQFQQLRSKFLDAFADLESFIAVMMNHAGKAVPAQHLGCRLNEFRKIEPNSRLARENLDRRNQLADKISALLPLRADIVHSTMRVSIIDGEPSAIFINAQNLAERSPPCRVMSQADITQLQEQVRDLTAQLRTLNRSPSPASLQPRPLPDAASAP